MHGYDAKLPLEAVIGGAQERHANVHEYAAELVDRLQATYERIHTILHEVNVNRSEDEACARILKLEVGDSVYVFDSSTKIGENAKLKSRWMGPYTVIEKKSEVVYVINRDGQHDAVSVSRMKRAHATSSENESDASVDDEHQHEYQMELVNKELEQLKAVQQQLLLQQNQKQEQLTQLQKQRQEQKSETRARKQHAESIAHASHVASQVIENDNDIYVDREEIESMCACMFEYVHAASSF
jgi:hypothetical protein